MVGLAFIAHVFEICWCKFLELYKFLLVYYLYHKGVVVGFVEAGVAFAARTVPALATIQTSDV